MVSLQVFKEASKAHEFLRSDLIISTRLTPVLIRVKPPFMSVTISCNIPEGVLT